MITKHNLNQTVEDWIKNNKFRYVILEQDAKGTLYEIHVGSIDGYAQLEYNLDDENDNDFAIQFYSRVDDWGLSLYSSDIDNYHKTLTEDDIFDEMCALIENVKRINSAVSKIGKKIDQIREICEEYNLEFEEFIELRYDFDA